MPPTRCLVVGSCTGQKDDVGCPEEIKLQATDFSTVAKLANAERRAKAWLKPAGSMYLGRQHALMMQGVGDLRRSFAKASFDVAIVSAGYGLISEERQIAPYDITFQGKGLPWAREQGAALKIPEMTNAMISKYQVVFFLLGKEYLSSLGVPPRPSKKQKFVYFGTGVTRFFPAESNILILAAAQKQSTQYGGAGVTGVKGRMFELFARSISSHPERWEDFMGDPTTKSLLDSMNAAKKRN